VAGKPLIARHSRLMNRTCTALLSAYVGWTVACHVSTLLHASLLECMSISPLLMLAAYAIARPRGDRPNQILASQSGKLFPLTIAPAIIVLAVLALRFSWISFWLGSILVLSYVLYADRTFSPSQYASTSPAGTLNSRYGKWVVFAFCLFAAALTLFANRSDLDDAFYVAVAAFAHAHPSAPLLASDPMFGQDHFPLIFPSYQFSSYELLGAAIAWILNIPAMDVIYRFLAPLAAMAAVASIFFCSKQIYPRQWIVTGIIAVTLLLVLGENHRSFGNFAFVRIFQGKAIFLTAMVPLIYGLSFRYQSQNGTSRDLLLLVYAQLAAIGLSNFAPLAAPMAGLTASLAAHPIDSRRLAGKFLKLSATCAVALPYLAWIAWSSHDAAVLANNGPESASAAWREVFGPTQQFLIASILLLGPLLTSDRTLRWRLAVPCIALLAVLLNPWLAGLIARYVTTPPVYWRVTWIFPLTVFLAVGIMVIAERLTQAKLDRELPFAVATGVGIATLGVISLQGNVARPANHVQWRFAARKVDANDMAVAELAIQATTIGKILAPDNIAGLIPIHEKHPDLVNVRSFYIDMLQNAMSPDQYRDRQLLASWVNGFNPPTPLITKALTDLDVTTTVTQTELTAHEDTSKLLKAADFSPTSTSYGYTIWTKNSMAPQGK
jgi:hypothetical protein